VAIVRTLRPDETDAAADLTARVFGKPEEYAEMSALVRAAYNDCPFMEPDMCWVAEVGGRIVVKWQLLDFEMWIAGTPIRMGGVQALAAEPDENHKGYAKEVALVALPQLREMEIDLLLGFAQRGAFYRKLGGVVLGAEHEVEFDARGIPPLAEDPFREWSEAEDLPSIIAEYNRSNAQSTGPLVRNEALWPWLVRRPRTVHLCEEGYVGVTFVGNRLEIREVCGQGTAFHDAAVRKIAALAREAGVRRIWGNIAPDHPFTAAAAAYGVQVQSTYSHKSGCMGLVLAPLRLVAQLCETLDARLQASRYHDVHLDLGLEVPGENARLALNPEGREGRKLDLHLPGNALLQLAMGHVSAEQTLLSNPGACLEAGEGDNLALLDTVFPAGYPFMWRSDRY
jgi:hypothetical protein